MTSPRRARKTPKSLWMLLFFVPSLIFVANVSVPPRFRVSVLRCFSVIS